jgi:hypothetical protein
MLDREIETVIPAELAQRLRLDLDQSAAFQR